MMHTRAHSLPYGTWPSPISPELVAGKSLRLAQPLLHNDAVYWIETRPREQGRNVLLRWTADTGHTDITPAPYSVQSRVHEYGGGAYAIHGDAVWFVNKQDQGIYRVRDGEVRTLLQVPGLSFADLVHDPQRQRLLAVCEQHDADLPEARTTLVAIDTRNGTLVHLCSGCDFYSSPRVSPDGRRLLWLEWNHPDMPWDATRLMVADFDADGLPQDTQCIAGGDNESVLQPGWRDAQEIVFVSDRNDWWNLYAWRADETRALCERAAEFALPHWVFGMQNWALRDAGTIACSYTENGRWQVAELEIDSGHWRELPLPYTQIEHLHAAGNKVLLLAASAQQAATVALLDTDNQPLALRRAADVQLDAALLAPPEPVTFKTGNDDLAHALYYAPANPGFSGPPDSAPPLLVKVHGGPTAATSSALDLKIRFWTSRGFAVLDVNYRGSTGYGRRYRERLYGEWGLAEVEDCIKGALALAQRGLADPGRLLISGSSAGGYTVLAALTFHDVFAAGASYYGIGDLQSAMRDTEKFESRYGDRLIGPLPEYADVWRARSPLHHASRLRRPVIFFQGLEDRVVPPDQSERMYEAARANGVETAYLPFPDEGHGFRRAETIAAALEAEYAFYCRVLKIDAAVTRKRDATA